MDNVLQHSKIAALALVELERAPGDAARLRIAARIKGRSLASLARQTHIPYVRLERVLNSRQPARAEEIAVIAAALNVELPE